MVSIPDGALSDIESISNNETGNLDYKETPDASESDCSLDDDEPKVECYALLEADSQ